MFFFPLFFFLDLGLLDLNRRGGVLFLAFAVAPLGLEVTLRQLVELVFFLVKLAELDVEAGTSEDGKTSDNGVVHDQVGVFGERGEGLAEGGGKGGHEEGDGLDHGTHALGRLGVGVLQRGDGGKDLGEGNEHIGTRLGPDVDGDLGALNGLAGLVELAGEVAGRVLAAHGALVDVVLDDGGPDHGRGTGEEAGGNLLDGGEFDAGLAEGRVDEEIVDGDEDKEGEGVEVGEDVVGDAVALHDGGLGDEVAVDWEDVMLVAETVTAGE